ncbi:unnamed protein product [Symbiodinium necroappetens]|uniref:Uncharacterized protein n=1 Tax=Symbiodinium necroappetens TaxID=1628268 RepID=A0A813BS98_9DINO|nr:unnamed protein product [Symbiodinium necroappetens]
MLNNFVMLDTRLFNGREGLLTGLKKHLVDVNFLRRGAGSALLYPFGNRITQLLRHRIVTARCLVQSRFIKGYGCSLARRQQKVIHDSEVGLESEVSNVKPPCAYGRFGDSDSFRLGIRCSGISSCVKRCVASGPTYVWHGWLDLGLKVTSNHQRGTQRDTGNCATQFAEKGLSFVTQDSRVDCEVVRKLVAIEELNPTLGSLKLCAKNATRLDLFMANGVSPVAWMYQGENTVRSGLCARVYGSPALDNKF